MVPVLHAGGGAPPRVSLRGFERSHPQLVCVLIREMGKGSEARASLISSPRSLASRPLTASDERQRTCRRNIERGDVRVVKPTQRREKLPWGAGDVWGVSRARRVGCGAVLLPVSSVRCRFVERTHSTTTRETREK